MIYNSTLKIKSLILCLVSIMCMSSIKAQERSCGMVEYMQEQMKDPEYAKQHKISQAKFKAQLEKNLNGNYERRINPILIPVAVHFPSGSESDRACLEALAQNQVDILNEDFTGTNADISDWDDAQSFYPGVSTGAANFLFCLATKNHPTGIDSEMVEGGPAVTIGYNFGSGGSTDSNWSGYMNFLVKQLSGGVLGFSPLRGSVANGQSVTMNLGAFGSGAGCPGSGIVPGAPYNLGRTVTHELGHFYNLEHTFSGSCSTDDGIADTPNQSSPSGGCPTLGNKPACNSGEQVLFQSYMDYTNDACMFMFSNDQATVQEAYVTSIESTFKQNVADCSIAPSFSLSTANPEKTICNPTNTVDYTINYVATGGNTTATTFSATNLPSGATASFTPTSLSADGSTLLTLNNLGSIAVGNYAITVTGVGAVTNSTSVNLNIEGGIPTMPALSSPENNVTGVSTQLNLSWNPVTDVSSYTIEIATNESFTANLISNVVTTNSFNTPELEGITRYFWRVKSTNDCGDSSYSSIRNFKTASINCDTYNSTENNINIPSSGGSDHVVTSTLTITDNISITDINVTANIEHTWAGDIEIKLTSPNGTDVIITAHNTCNDGTNDIFVTYNDQASGPVDCSTTSPAIGGNIQPENPLSAFNGESSLGDWILTVTDDYALADGGTFQNFSLEICGINSVLSVDEYNLTDSLSLWPNPSNGTVNIVLNTNNSNKVNISLFDLRGRVIDAQSFNNSGIFSEKLNYQNIETAVYILRIENNGQSINKRIIINN